MARTTRGAARGSTRASRPSLPGHRRAAVQPGLGTGSCQAFIRTFLLCERTLSMYVRVMDAAERMDRLVETLRRAGRVDVAAAAAEFGAAEMTIRRDLDVLVDRGVARRVRGGAVNLMMRGEELPFAMRAIEATGSKRRNAEAVAGLIADGGGGGVDRGTTLTGTARAPGGGG